eukprot:gene14676-17353_t
MNLSSVLILPLAFLMFENNQDTQLKNNSPLIHSEVFLKEVPKPKKSVSYEQGIDMIVKGLKLNIDHIRFIKAPKATDYFIYADDQSGYAQSLIIAANNGMKLPRNMKPAAVMSREQFALLLQQAIQSTGNYPTNMMFLVIKDAAAFSSGSNSSAVQDLVKYNVVALDKGYFRPKAVITQAEALKMVKNAEKFVHSSGPKNDDPDTAVQDEVVLTSAAVNAEVNRILISRGSKPNSGYGIEISGIDFISKTEAVVRYKLINPAPGNAYLQVVTEPKAETFISSAYKVGLKKN